MFGQLERFKYKVFLRRLRRRSDERRPEAFKARLDAGAGRLVDLVQSLELLGAQLAVSLDVLPVKGLCGSIRSTNISWVRAEPPHSTAAVTHRHRCSPVPGPPARGTRSLCRCSWRKHEIHDGYVKQNVPTFSERKHELTSAVWRPPGAV